MPIDGVMPFGNEALIEWLHGTINTAQEDYKEGKFQQYTPYTTSYGTRINNIEEAIIYNNLHKGMHFGFMKAIFKMV